MDLPSPHLMDHEACVAWLRVHLHPNGFGCPDCGSPVATAREFRETRSSRLKVYRCGRCDRAYNLYTGTALQQRHLTPQQAVCLLRGVAEGVPATTLTAKLDVSYRTTLDLQRALQSHSDQAPPPSSLPRLKIAADELG